MSADRAMNASLEARFGAGNYAPLPVTIVRGEGVYVWDESGHRYIDMIRTYSAVSFGHCHPRLVKALTEQPSASTRCRGPNSVTGWDLSLPGPAHSPVWIPRCR
jgi:acetylornithine/succinyldiaminopimelate/putrescine aminotransferase